MRNKFKRYLSLLLVFLFLAGTLNVPVNAVEKNTADHVIISQVYGGGGNSGAQYKNDFIELYNPTNKSIDLTGWSVQYASAKGDFNNITVLSGSIGPSKYYLIQEAEGNNKDAAPLPAPDAEGNIAMSGTNGKVALANKTTAIESAADSSVIDFVGFGSANAYEGTAPTKALSNSTAAVRKFEGVDTDDNNADFEITAPNPRNSEYKAPIDETKCAIPAASIASGYVTKGTEVTFTTETKDAVIEYNTVSESDWTTKSAITVSSGSAITVTVTKDTAYYVRAVKEGLENSDVATFSYTIDVRDPNVVLNIKEVLELPSGTKDVVVAGQIVYFATTYSNPVIQTKIDGKTYSLYVYGAASDNAKVGDLVKLKGTYTIYNGLPELMSVTESEIIGSETPMKAETVTIDKLKSDGKNMIGRFVKIENVTLGSYNNKGNTSVSDGTGSINIYNAAPYPALAAAGDVVDIYAMVANYNGTIQLYTGTKEANGFNVYDVVNDTKRPVITLPESYLEAKVNQDYTISVGAEDNKGIKEVILSYTIGQITLNKPMALNKSTGKYEYTIPGAEIPAAASSIEFTIKAEDVSGLEAVSALQTVNINNAPQIIAVSPQRNSSTGDNKAPVISVTLENAGTSPKVTLTLKKGNTVIVDNKEMTEDSSKESLIYNYATSALEDGIYDAAVTAVREDLKSTSEAWKFTVGESRYKTYFGQLHAHTAEYSDGSGTLNDGLNYIANIESSDNVDFVSFTDHSNYFDTTSAANPAEALNDKTKMTSESLKLWNKYVSDMESFNEENAGSIVALPGFEMTWSGGPGHINTFNSDGLVSRNDGKLNSKTADAGLKLYYETLIQNSDPLANLSQFNHPGTTFGTFSDFAYWSPAYDNKMVAVEVGNGEGAIGSGGYFPSYSEYTKALDKGWHVAPTNNQDNHKGHWGNSNAARTVIITDNLSSEGLLTGLKNRSVYSTEDKNLNIDYKVNDLIMGSIISEMSEEALKFDINIDDEDADDIISKVEIITNGGRIAESETFDSNVVNWSFELPVNQGYYYVRVTQADKNIAVTAPVWVGQAPLAGISSLEADTKMPVTGEVLEITATLFNNEETSVKLNSIEYSQGDVVLKTDNLNEDIASAGTLKHIFDYTFTAAGNAKITVTAVMTINGQEKIFTQDLNLVIRDSKKLVYVGIDASHYNEYVNGNYKDSMGNFADMAVDYGVRVVELKSDEELIEAAGNPQYRMLVLTPPTRRNGSAFLIGYKNYSDEVINAVKEFAESGKTVIITGWGDYYEGYSKYSDGTPFKLPPSDQMSAQQNKLLAAIGSNLRLSDDEIKDDGINGGQPQRLYLTEYNLDNSFLQRVKPLEQVYSNYGGSTIYAVGEDGLPGNTLTSSISPMVYAFDTSYSSDDDGDGTTGIEGVDVPKYENKYMVAASETVIYDNGAASTIIVAGSAFMSNFEIQVEMDNYSTPAYSNYTILENVVKSINPVIISDIAKVQEADENETFTIRGIVTSNASGYDKDTAFFDCIYVQDATAGINAFPVSGNIRAGQTVEITGTTSAYNGERQIAVEKITVIDETIKPLPAPISLTTAEAFRGDKLGSLVKVEGKIVSIDYANNAVESIFVKDSSNTQCRVFIDGYITSNKTIANLAVGTDITAAGLSSIDTEGTRIRIRDRADIICTKANEDSDNDDDDDDNKNKSKPISKEENKNTDGSVKYVLDETAAYNLIEQVKKADREGTDSVFKITVDSAESNKDIKVVIPKAIFKEIATETKAKVEINTGLGSITLNEAAVKKIYEEAGGEEISIAVSVVDSNALSSGLQGIVGDRPIYDFSVTAGSKKISSFGKDGVKVSLSYILEKDEDANSILVYYLNDSGNLQNIRGNYNSITKTVDFLTPHFSKYVIGYNNIAFTDVGKSDWYYDAVSYITAREISKGTGVNTFGPNMSLTRGQFLVLVMNAYNIKPDADTADNFEDAGDTYYTGYLAAAKRLGITKGTGGSLFAPDAVISRQDMVTLLYNILNQANELPENKGQNNIGTFNDAELIDSYAEESMRILVESGLISGSNGRLNPKGTATRAEMAQILYNLLIIK